MPHTEDLFSPWIRLVLAISLDGRISSDQEEGPIHLGGPGDKRVLEEALAWADGTLMGSNTLRAHHTTCLIKDPDLIKRRVKDGRSEQPISVVVSKHQNHSLSWPFFKQPIRRWLLRPPEALKKADQNTNIINGYESHITMGKTWSDTLKKLKDLGLSRIVLLGGAQLVKSILQADQIDELQLTIVPKILGGKNCWLPISTDFTSEHLTLSEAWTLKKTKVLEGNELMLSYFRNHPFPKTKNHEENL